MSTTPIKQITFHVREILNGYIVTDAGEKYYATWSEIVDIYFKQHPDDLGFSGDAVFIEFTVSFPVSNK